jgi:hypothetical protein
MPIKKKNKEIQWLGIEEKEMSLHKRPKDKEKRKKKE